MEIFEGYIRTWFADRKFGYLRNNRTRVDSFFHLSNVNGDPKQLASGVQVRYSIEEYESKGQRRTKAINIELVVPMPEVPSIPQPAPVAKPEPEPMKFVCAEAPPRPAPTAMKSLGTDTSARAKFQHSNAKHVATLVDAKPRGQVKPSPVDGSAQ